MRVVCPIDDKATAVYYALIKCDEETRLCEGVHVNMEEVFFFEEFRQDDLTSVQQRKTQWAKKVRDCMGVVCKRRETMCARKMTQSLLR